MIPDPFFSRGVTLVGGIKVTDPARLLRIISEGGGTRQFKGACEQIIIRSVAQRSQYLDPFVQGLALPRSQYMNALGDA